MKQVEIYLSFNGNCEFVFDFYKSIFGGEYTYKGYFKDMPENKDFVVAEEDKEKIMHMSLTINDKITLMGSDTCGSDKENYIQGNNFFISINASSKTEADQLFSSLSLDGTVTMPMGDTFWGSYFGSLTDQFGVQWMISTGL